MGNLILGNGEECYLCGETRELESHLIFTGCDPRTGKRCGAYATLCAQCHRGKYGVHGAGKNGLWLRQEAQDALMKREHWTIAEFVRVFGRNYV